MGNFTYSMAVFYETLRLQYVPRLFAGYNIKLTLGVGHPSVHTSNMLVYETSERTTGDRYPENGRRRYIRYGDERNR